MGCRLLVEVPKAAFRRLYLPPPVASFVSPYLASEAPSSSRLTQCRWASSEPIPNIPEVPEVKESIILRMRRSLGLLEYSKPYYRAIAVFIYEKLDTLEIDKIFTEFELEDTFYSWYLVMELHLWILLSRASQHGKEGHYIKESLGTTLWEDVRRRMKLIATNLPQSEQNNTLEGLSSEMDFAVVLYDEAVRSNDKRLAEALWVRLYRGREVDPIILEKLVCYVRKQIQHLDLIPREQFVLKGDYTWLPVKECGI